MNSLKWTMIAALSVFSLNANGAPKNSGASPNSAKLEELFAPTIEPNTIEKGKKAKVSFRAESKPIIPKKAFIELEQVDEKGRVIKKLGRLTDDGKHNDLAAKDGTYGLTLNVKRSEPTVIRYRLHGKYKSKWIYSPIAMVEITDFKQPSNTQAKNSISVVNDPELGEIVEGKIILVMKVGASATKIKKIAKTVNAKIMGRSLASQEVRWELDLGKGAGPKRMKNALAKLRKRKDVLSATPDHVAHLN